MPPRMPVVSRQCDIDKSQYSKMSRKGQVPVSLVDLPLYVPSPLMSYVFYRNWPLKWLVSFLIEVSYHDPVYGVGLAHSTMRKTSTSCPSHNVVLSDFPFTRCEISWHWLGRRKFIDIIAGRIHQLQPTEKERTR